MKSILSASICTAALAFAIPAMAATETKKPMHHHMSKHERMAGGKMHGKHSGKAMDASTDELNAKSLAAAKSGMAPAGADSAAPAPAAAPASSMAPSSSMAPAATGSGTTGTTAPSNAPGGQ